MRLTTLGTVDRVRSQSLQQVSRHPVPDVDEPGQNFALWAAKDVLIQKDQLLRQNGSVFIEDLDSYNGIKVNGRFDPARYEQARLQNPAAITAAVADSTVPATAAVPDSIAAGH